MSESFLLFTELNMASFELKNEHLFISQKLQGLRVYLSIIEWVKTKGLREEVDIKDKKRLTRSYSKEVTYQELEDFYTKFWPHFLSTFSVSVLSLQKKDWTLPATAVETRLPSTPTPLRLVSSSLLETLLFPLRAPLSSVLLALILL